MKMKILIIGILETMVEAGFCVYTIEMNQNSLHNRRIRKRLCCPYLSIMVKKAGLFSGVREKVVVTAIDYTPFGIGILSSAEFKVGNEILADLSTKDITISDVVGFVVNTEKVGENYRLGIQFDFSANAYMASKALARDLEKLEDLLRKNQIPSQIHPT